jgi:hypothetical protein
VLNNRVTSSNAWYQPLTGSAANTTNFRTYVLPLLNGTDPGTRLPGARLTSIEVTTRNNQLAVWRDEANTQGFADRAFVYACDEPDGNSDPAERDRRWNTCASNSDIARAVWPQVPVLATASITSVTGRVMTTRLDTLAVLVNQMHDRPGNSQYAGNQRPKYDTWAADTATPTNKLWLYTSCESHGCGGDSAYHVGWAGYAIDQPATESRAMGWLAYRYRASGELYYQTMESLGTAWTDQWKYTGNGDGNIFYPWDAVRVGGADPIPVESLRLKRIRDGYEDNEYLTFLAGHGAKATADAEAGALFPTPYQANPTDAALQTGRLRLAQAVAAIVGGPQPS